RRHLHIRRAVVGIEQLRAGQRTGGGESSESRVGHGLMSQQEEARAVAQQEMRRPVAQQKARQTRGDGLEAQPPEVAGAETSERHHDTSVTLSVPADVAWMAATLRPGASVNYSVARGGR